jgi:benzoyl-CoA reductase/2-hydroxyglutaryl-CoA dehydratase subunit BcrC/BadD/HgdB
MSDCCTDKKNQKSGADCPVTWFRDMVPHCLDYARKQKQNGAKIVGIMCEYTPRELILAAGGVPVCLCGGSAKMVSPAEEYLPANLCPLIKSTFGYSIQKANPFLEMADLLVGETTCDGKKKMYELLGERHPMHVLELPQKPDDRDSLEHWVLELRKLKQVLETRFKLTVTDDSIRNGVQLMNQERKLRRQVAELMKSESPPVTGRELLDMKSLISCIPQDLRQYENAQKALAGRRLDPPADSRTRVLLTGVPLPHGAERVMDIIENNGGLVVCQENCTGIKPIWEDVDEKADDPIRALAEKYFHIPCSTMTPNNERKNLLRLLKDLYRPECIIELIWQACITYDVESYQIKEFAENELGLPYLRIETDYSPSDSERIGLRVQALFETVNGG